MVKLFGMLRPFLVGRRSLSVEGASLSRRLFSKKTEEPRKVEFVPDPRLEPLLEWKGPPKWKMFITDPKVMMFMAVVISTSISYFNRPPAQSEAPKDENKKKFKPKLFADSHIAHMRIFTGTGNPELSREVASNLSTHLGRAKISRFADGEINVNIIDDVRGDDVFVIQSAPPPNVSPDSSIMEALLMVSAIRRSSAKRITVVLPYMSYSRQTHIFDASHPRPIASADVCRMFESLGADNVVLVDAHNPRMEGFFPPEVTCINLDPQVLAVHYFANELEDPLQNPVVLAADLNGAERAKAFWNRLRDSGFPEAEFATYAQGKKERPSRVNAGYDPEDDSPADVDSFFFGDVKGKDVLIVDDIIDSGELCGRVSQEAKRRGARRIFFYCTHGVFSKGAVEKVEKSAITECVVTNTIMLPSHVYSEKIQILSVGKMLAETIKRIHFETSLKGMADEQAD